jgi:hypothetical protein
MGNREGKKRQKIPVSTSLPVTQKDPLEEIQVPPVATPSAIPVVTPARVVMFPVPVPVAD